MRAMSVIIVGLGTVVAGFWLVSIMGSGPCEPPPCGDVVGEACQQTCNGPLTFSCRGTPPNLQCLPAGPCDPDKCPPAPPCYTRLCANPTLCGGTASDLCCHYESTGAGSGCPLTGQNPDDPSTWTGTCSDTNVCE